MIRIGRNYIKSLAAKATRSSTFCKVNFREHTFTAHYCTNSAMNVSTPHWIVCHSRPSTAVGYCAIGNGTPVELTLGDLDVTGVNVTWTYKMKKWVGGIPGGAFRVNFLGTDGTFEHSYYWLWTRTGSQTEPVDSMRWCKYEGDSYVDLTQDELDAIKIPAGQAMWILGSGHKLNIPAPEL